MSGTFIQKFLSNRKFQALFASPNRYFTENSRWGPLFSTVNCFMDLKLVLIGNSDLLRFFCGIKKQIFQISDISSKKLPGIAILDPLYMEQKKQVSSSYARSSLARNLKKFIIFKNKVKLPRLRLITVKFVFV